MTAAIGARRGDARTHDRNRFQRVGRALLATCLAALAACSGGGGSSPPPAVRITAQPADVHVVAGAGATFLVGVAGAASLQWQRSSAGGAWADVAGANALQYVTPATQDADNGAQFRVVVTPAEGAALTSSAATLTVDPAPVAPVITVQPVDASVVADQDASFSVTATGTAIAYRWQRSADGTAWNDIAGATAATLTMVDLTTADNGTQVHVVISNAVGSVTSAVAHLAVLPVPQAPSFTTSPSGVSVVAGQAATFNAQAVGTPVPDIAWQSSPDGSTWTTIPGAAAGSYSIGVTSLSDNGRQFRAVASNASGSVDSAAALLTVTPVPMAPTILAGPASATVAGGGSVTFSVTAGGQPAPTCQWQLSTDGGATFANINAAIGSSLFVNGVTPSQDGWRYRVVATNASGSATSAAATLTVPALPVVTLQPAAATWRPGAVPAFFIGAATGAGVSLQWQTSTDAGTTWTNAVGATGASFVYPASGDRHVNAVRFVATNAGGASASVPATLTPHDWAPVTPAVTTSALYAVRWTSASTVLATGLLGQVLRSTDGGVTWAVVAEPASSHMHALAASGQAAIAVGDGGGGLRSPDGGAHWLQVPTIGTSSNLHGLAFSGTAATAVGDGGAVRRTTDGGASWQAAASDGGTTNLIGVAFNASGVGLAVGDSGTVLRSVDGGANWTSVRTGSESLRDVSFVDATTAVAVGYAGAVLRSADAGLTWRAVATGSTQSFIRVAFDAAGDGTAVDGLTAQPLHSADGGATWSRLAAPMPAIVAAVAYAPTGSAAVAVGPAGELETSADGGLTWTSRTPGNRNALWGGIAFASANVGVAVGDLGTVLRTVDGGGTWSAASTPVTAQPLLGVTFAGAQIGVAVGAVGTIWRSTDAGATWTSVSSGTAARLAGVAFSTATHGVAVGVDGMVYTDDAGATWLPASGPGYPGVTSVAFGSALVGTAVGAKDSPGFGFADGIALHTVDGGITWQRQALPVSVALSAVAYSDANTVTAVGSNGEVRSTDGGITWTAPPEFGIQWRALRFTSATEGVSVGGSFFAVTHDAGLTWPGGSWVVGDDLLGVAANAAGAVFVTTEGGAIYRNLVP